MSKTCPVCGEESKLVFIERYRDNDTNYSLFSCSICGVHFWIPFKNPGAEWYEEDERYKGANADPVIEPTSNHKKVLKYFNHSKGKVLDIGCGTGNFLYLAKNSGWEVFGIDFDRNAVNTAETFFKLPNIKLTTLNDYVRKNKDAEFDLITFFDVFEHIDNHKEFLSQVSNLLTEKGYIAMSMPYRHGFRWLMPHDLPPRHLTRWDRKSLEFILKKNGFNVLLIRREPASPLHILMKLRFKYAKYISMNLVGKAKNKIRKSGKIELDKQKEKNISLIHKLARIKDWVIFGIPTLLIWISLLLTKKRYIGLFVIARKKE